MLKLVLALGLGGFVAVGMLLPENGSVAGAYPAPGTPVHRYGDDPIGYPFAAYTPTPGVQAPTPTRWPIPSGTPDASGMIWNATHGWYDSHLKQWWVKGSDGYWRPVTR